MEACPCGAEKGGGAVSDDKTTARRAADLAAAEDPEAAVFVLVARLVPNGTDLDFVTNISTGSTIRLLRTVLEKLESCS